MMKACSRNSKMYAHFLIIVPEMVFDPDQDPEEKRAVRQGYRALTKKIEGRSFIILSQFVQVLDAPPRIPQ